MLSVGALPEWPPHVRLTSSRGAVWLPAGIFNIYPYCVQTITRMQQHRCTLQLGTGY